MVYKKRMLAVSLVLILSGCVANQPRGDSSQFNEQLRMAEKGDSNAQFVVGSSYYAGKGVTKDLSQAAYWIKKSAISGNGVAQYYMGTFYEDGDAAEKNPKEALYWYQQSQSNGYQKASARISALYQKYPQLRNEKAMSSTAELGRNGCLIDRRLGVNAGFPKSDVDNKLKVVPARIYIQDPVCALKSVGSKEANEVASCLEKIASYEGVLGAKLDAESAIKTCGKKWEELYYSKYEAAERYYANCYYTGNLSGEQKEKRIDFYVKRKVFAGEFSKNFREDGTEGQLLDGRSTSSKINDENRAKHACFPKDLDTGLLKMMINFRWANSVMSGSDGKYLFDSFPYYVYNGGDGLTRLGLNVLQSIKEVDGIEEKRKSDIAEKTRKDQEARDRENYAQKWRKNIQEGDYTNRGMVIGLRGNLVEVEEEYCNLFGGNCRTSRKFFRRDELYPAK